MKAALRSPICHSLLSYDRPSQAVEVGECRASQLIHDPRPLHRVDFAKQWMAVRLM